MSRILRFFIPLLLITLFATAFITPAPRTAQAQSDEVLARVDQAMEHLSGYLGFSITRRSHYWFWAEVVYENAALGCPVPGETYTPESTRAYRIRIEVDGVEYDYRTLPDGSVMILCIEGRPSPASTGVDIPSAGTEGSTTPVSETVVLSPSDWYAWVYSDETDMLYLLNPAGKQAEIERPKLPDEAPIGNDNLPQIAISRDSRYMLTAARLTTGVEGMGIYSFEENEYIQVYQAGNEEEIFIGNALSFHPTLNQVAVGYSRTNFDNPGWRVVVYDLVSGNALYQLSAPSPFITSTFGANFPGEGVFFPSIRYFGPENNGVVHFILILGFAGGSDEYPAVAWYPNANFAEESPYYLATLDVLPTTGEAVFPYQDPGFTALPPNGPFTSFNAIARGTPDDFETVWVDGTRYHFNTRWANSGDWVLFMTGDGDGNNRWSVLDIAGRTSTTMPASVAAAHGTPNGFLTVSDTGLIQNFVAPAVANGSVIWQAPEDTPTIFWVTPPDSVFGLESLTTTSSVTTGPTVCPGAPPTRLTVSSLAESLPEERLRLRASPGGEYLLSLDQGTRFTIVGGPQCNGNFTWWQVRLTDGTTGWAAEGGITEGENEYFIEPVTP